MVVHGRAWSCVVVQLREVRLVLSILFRGRSGGGVVLGVTLLSLGLGLTVWSFQSAAPGGTRVIFVGLILGGCARLVTAALTPSPGRRYNSHAGPARVAGGTGGFSALPASHGAL